MRRQLSLYELKKNQSIPIKDYQKITLDDVNDSEILLTPISSTWETGHYLTDIYKISLTTTRGNFFTTVAHPILIN